MTRPSIWQRLFPRLAKTRQVRSDLQAIRPSLLRLEDRLTPASAVFSSATNQLTITLGANEAFDYFNEYRDTVNNNALVATAGYFKLSKYSSTGWDSAAWGTVTDASKTWVKTQVGTEGIANDSLQLGAGKSVDGIAIKVVGGTGYDAAYFRANPGLPDGKFSGALEVASSVDDTVVQDYNLYNTGDISLLSPMVTAYADILGGKNVTLTTASGTSPVFYVENSRLIQAGGASGLPGYSLTINSTIEGTTKSGTDSVVFSNPGGPVTLGSSAGGNLPTTVLGGLTVLGSSITTKGTFYFAADHMRFMGPVILDSSIKTVFSVDTELLLDQGISSGATPREVAFDLNGGAVATIHPLAGGAPAVFSSLEMRPVPGSDGAKVLWSGQIQAASSSGTIKVNVPLYLTADTSLKATSTIQVGATGSIQSASATSPVNLTIDSSQLLLTGSLGNENPLASLSLIGGLKTLAATSITSVGNITQTGSSNTIQITSRLTAISQKGGISIPNRFMSADTAKTGALKLQAAGKLDLYQGATTQELVDFNLAGSSIDLAPALTASGPGGIVLDGALTLRGDNIYTVTDPTAPLQLGGVEGDIAGRVLTLTSAGGPVSITGAVGQSRSLTSLSVTGAGSFSLLGSLKTSSTVSIKADGLTIGGPLQTESATLGNNTLGKTLVLGGATGGALTLDLAELANLKATTLTLGRADALNATGLITVSGPASLPGVGTLRLIAPEGVTTSNDGGIAVTNLVVSGSKNVNLSGKNQVGNLSGGMKADLIFANIGSLVLGSTSGQLSATGKASLSAGGAISQAADMVFDGLLDLSASKGLGVNFAINLTNTGNRLAAVRLGYAGAVNLASSSDLALSQQMVTEGSATVPALVESLTATSTTKLVLAGNLDISGPIHLNSTTSPLSLAGGNQIHSTALSGVGIDIAGGIANATGSNLTLDSGAGSLVVDSIALTGGVSALTIPSLGGNSSIGLLTAGPVTVQSGTGTLDLHAPTTKSLAVTGGSLGLTLSSLAGVGSLSAYNTGTTSLGSTTKTLTLPAATTVNKLGVASGVTILSFPGGGTLLSPFTIRSGMTLNLGDAASDILTIPGGLTVATGGKLAGYGTVQGNVLVENDGTYAPTDDIVTGNLTLNPGAKLVIDLSQATAGAGNSRLTVQGAAAIEGSILVLSNVTNYQPAKGTVFTALESPGGGTVSGTFAGVAEGGKVTGTSGQVSVSYTGSPSGHDILLTSDQEPIAAGVYAVAVTGGTEFSTLAIYENGTNRLVRTVVPFPGFKGEFFVDSGDISGDRVSDIIVGSGNGSRNGHVVVFDGARLLASSPTVPVELGFGSGGSVRASLYAFINYSSGVAVRLADMNDDGFDDIILAPATGAGMVTPAHLRVWDGHLAMQDFEAGVPLPYDYRWEMASFWAFGEAGNPGGGLALSVIRNNGPDQIVASQLFAGGSKVFSYTGAKVLHTDQDLSGLFWATGNTVVGLDINGTRFFANGGTSRSATDTVSVRNSTGTTQYTIPNIFGNTGGGLRIGLANVDTDSQLELLVTSAFTARTRVYDLTSTGYTFITELSLTGPAAWV